MSPVERLLAQLERRPMTALELADALGYSTQVVYDTITKARRRGHKIVCRRQPEGMSVFDLA